MAGCQPTERQQDAAHPQNTTAEPRSPTTIHFSDATTKSKLDFVHDGGPNRTWFMPEIMAPGCAFLDYDNDGDLDIYFVNSGSPPGSKSVSPSRNRLFRREHNGEYIDVSKSSQLDDRGYGMGVATGDYDNDGWVDVYVTNLGGNRLYRNRGDGTFENVSASSGTVIDAWSTSAVFVDYDGDGWLDLYVANYLQLDPDHDCTDKTGRPEYCGPSTFPGTPDVLLHNNQDGTFDDVTAAAGIRGALHGLGVAAADLTNDGLVDIYVANDGDANQLWTNLGDGTFRDDAIVLGCAFNAAGQVEASMGIVCDDLDNDGDVDLFMTHLRGESNTLFVNESAGFRDATGKMKLRGNSMPLTGFGAAAADFDNDGDLDLALVNGHVFRGPETTGSSNGPLAAYQQHPVVLENRDGSFRDVTSAVGSFGTAVGVGRGLAVGDADNDGDLDLLIANCLGPGLLFLNDSRPSTGTGNWLELDVRQGSTEHPRTAIGAVVRLTTERQTMVRTVRSGYSYLSSSDPRLHFGLGSAASVKQLQVEWPDGSKETFDIPSINRLMTIVQSVDSPPVNSEPPSAQPVKRP